MDEDVVGADLSLGQVNLNPSSGLDPSRLVRSVPTVVTSVFPETSSQITQPLSTTFMPKGTTDQPILAPPGGTVDLSAPNPVKEVQVAQVAPVVPPGSIAPQVQTGQLQKPVLGQPSQGLPTTIPQQGQPTGTPGIGQGPFGSNRTMYPSYNPQANNLDIAKGNLQAQINELEAKARDPWNQTMWRSKTMEWADQATQKRLQMQQIDQELQKQKDMQAQGANAGIPVGPLATENTITEALLKRYREGDAASSMSAADALTARGHKDLVEAYRNDQITSMETQLNRGSEIRQQLDVPNTDADYQSVRKQLQKQADTIGFDIPKSLGEWEKQRAQRYEKERQARVLIARQQQVRADQSDYTDETNENLKKVREGNFKYYNGETVNGTVAKTHLGNGSNGVAMEGANDLRKYGGTGEGAWHRFDDKKIEAVNKEIDAAYPKTEREKAIGVGRTIEMATTDPKTGKPMNDEQTKNFINTNPNVQQAVAEALASALRGGAGGANGQLIKIELAKRGVLQEGVDKFLSGLASAKGIVTGKEGQYLSKLTQGQIRYVLDFIKDTNERDAAARLKGATERIGMYGGRLDQTGLEKELQNNPKLQASVDYGRDRQKFEWSNRPRIIRDSDAVFLDPGTSGRTVPGAVTTRLPATALPGLYPELKQAPAASEGAPGRGGGSPPSGTRSPTPPGGGGVTGPTGGPRASLVGSGAGGPPGPPSPPPGTPIPPTTPTPQSPGGPGTSTVPAPVAVSPGGRPSGAYDTVLSPAEEQSFQQWKAKNAPNDSGADYDLRGAYKAGVSVDPQSGHWPDTFKKPNHPTFSDQSQYATGPDRALAGHWEGDKFIPPSNRGRGPNSTFSNGTPSNGFPSYIVTNPVARTVYGVAGQTAQNVSNNPVIANNSAIVTTSSAQSESAFNPDQIHDNNTGQGLFGHRQERLTSLQQFAGVKVTGKPGEPIPVNVQASFFVRELSKLADSDPFVARVLSDPNASAEDLTRVQVRAEKPEGYKGPGTEEKAKGWDQRLTNTRLAMGGGAAAPAVVQPAVAAAPAAAQPSTYQLLNPRTALETLQQRTAPAQPVFQAAPNMAPAVLGTAGALGGGAVAGPPGAVVGGMTGGAIGGAIKNYATGAPENQTVGGYAKEATFGAGQGAIAAIPGVGPLATAGRIAANAALPGVEKWWDTGDVGEAFDAALWGAAGGALGEGVGKALGLTHNLLWNGYSQGTKAELLAAGKILSEQKPKISDATGKMVENPTYTKAAERAEQLGQDPDNLAHAYNTAKKPLAPLEVRPTQREAIVTRPGAVEAMRVGRGYDEIRQQIAEAPKPKGAYNFADKPTSIVGNNKTVPEKFRDDADIAEGTMTRPAKTWGGVWDNQIAARAGLLAKEREAMAMAPGPGKDEAVKAYRALADQVRVQQTRIANKLLPPDKAQTLMTHLENMDIRYRRAMMVSKGDLPKIIAAGGDEGREAQAAFTALAGNDLAAQRVLNALVRLHRTGSVGAGLAKAGGATLASTLTMVHAIPVVGQAVSAGLTGYGMVKAYRTLNAWLAAKGAGSPVRFETMLRREITLRARSRIRQATTGITAPALAGSEASP